MKDSRVTVFRKALEGLIESLDATVRVGRWSETESVPQPLKDSAAHLVARLGAADRLASGRFNGSAADVARVSAIVASMRRLDAAYAAYCQQREGSPQERDLAAIALDAEISEVKAGAS